MTRQGLNATFSYPDAQGVTHAYQVRAGDLSHGVQMISAEDQGRTTRAYYPHKSARQQFSVQVLLKDWDERLDFNAWMASFAQLVLDPNVAWTSFPLMVVTVPSRGFTEHGIPLVGYEWGAHTGMMMFTPQFIFEAGLSPHQPAVVAASSVVNKWSAYASDPAIQYFYPFGDQLSGTQVPFNYGTAAPSSPVTIPYAPGQGPPPNLTGTGP